jgi:hypothetical protein
MKTMFKIMVIVVVIVVLAAQKDFGGVALCFLGMVAGVIVRILVDRWMGKKPSRSQ